MEKGVIETDPRHITRRIRTAMQGNAIRALVELITNSNDSYILMEESGLRPAPVIEILYKKEGYSGFFAVRDYAQGMSIEDIRKNFKKYGAASGETPSGKRGYFGQGAKDALAGMQDGQICSFKDEQFNACSLYIENGQTMYEISDSIAATSEVRKKYGITGNGTYACFRVNPQKQGRVPQFDTVYGELSKNYQLRKIMCNRRRSVWLIDDENGKKRQLRYEMPTGKEIHNDNFNVERSPYGVFPIHISIWRSEHVELTQTGDDRDGGILLIDEKDAVLGISLFRFDNEPLAARLFGEVKISRFRELLDHEEPVLSEERDGLISRHPFCHALINEIEKRLESAVSAERVRKQNQAQSQIDSEENSRYKKAFNLLNEIAEEETQTAINLGQKTDEQMTEPPNGFCLYPSAAEITVGKRYNFELRILRNKVKNGATVNISCSHPKIHVLTKELQITSKDNSQMIRKHITLQGIEPNIEGVLRANIGELISTAKIHVIPEKEFLMDEGMEFSPGSITLRSNQPKKAYLIVHVKIISGGSTIRISSDNENVHISEEFITVNEAEAVRHMVKYELEIWGEGAGQHAIITAECESYMALLDVRLKSKEEEEDKGRKGMFGEPEFDSVEAEPQQRTTYSLETGKVTIYVNFPSIKHYLGENRCYVKTLPAQVLIADLVAERCFYEIARKKVEGRAALLNPEAAKDLIQRDASDLSKKYGKKVHEVLVDQTLLKQAKTFSNGKQLVPALVQ